MDAPEWAEALARQTGVQRITMYADDVPVSTIFFCSRCGEKTEVPSEPMAHCYGNRSRCPRCGDGYEEAPQELSNGDLACFACAIEDDSSFHGDVPWTAFQSKIPDPMPILDQSKPVTPEAMPSGGGNFLSSLIKEVSLEFNDQRVHTAFHCRACGRCVDIDHGCAWGPERADYVGEDFTPKAVGRLCSECFAAKRDWCRGSERKVPFEFCRAAPGEAKAADRKKEPPQARFVAGRRRGARRKKTPPALCSREQEDELARDGKWEYLPFSFATFDSGEQREEEERSELALVGK